MESQTRAPFPGNQIPKTLLGPRRLEYPELLAAAEQSKCESQQLPWVGNFVQGSKWPTSLNVWVLKFDHKISDKTSFLSRTNKGAGFFNFNYDFPGRRDSWPQRRSHRPNEGLAIDEVHLFSPSTVLDTRIGYAYGKEQQQPFSAGFDPATLGFPAAYVDSLQFNEFSNHWRERLREPGRRRLEKASLGITTRCNRTCQCSTGNTCSRQACR